MKTTHLLWVAAAMLLAACKNDIITISGTVERDVDSLSVAVMLNDNSDTLLAKVPVTDGKYTWEGTVDSACILRVYYGEGTRDFYREFAEALSQLDEVILTDIYPAREKPIEGVTSQLIYDCLAPGVEKQLISKDDVIPLVKRRSFDVLIVLGAGDLDEWVPQMTNILKRKIKNKP